LTAGIVTAQAKKRDSRQRNLTAGIVTLSRNRVQHLSDWSTYSGWVYLAKINNSKMRKLPLLVQKRQGT